MYRGDGRPPAKRTRHSNKKTAYEDKTEENSDVKLVLAPVPINKHVMELVSIVKPHIRNLIEDSNLVFNQFNIFNSNYSSFLQNNCIA